MSPSDTDLDPWFVTGLVEGNGVFTYNRNRAQLAVVFAMRAPAGDLELLAAVRKFFGGAGRLYEPESQPGSGRHAYYRITRHDHLLRVVEHLDRHRLRGRKKELYRIWREMVLLRSTYHRSRPPGELDELARALSDASTRDRASGKPA